MQKNILQLKPLTQNGVLFHHYEQERIEAFIPTNCPSNHAASLAELPNGDLLCAWFAGSDEGTSDIKVFMSRLRSGSDRWEEPVRLSDDFTKAEQNPSLFAAPDGKLWLMYTAMDTRGCSLQEWKEKLARNEVSGSFAMQDTSVIRRRISEDNGYTWGPAEILFDRPGSFGRHPIAVLSNGDWIYGVWYSISQESAFGSDFSVFKISSDQGKTWKEHPVPGSKGRVHPSVVEVDPGKLIAFFRSRSADHIYMSRSDDYGRTWTVPEKTVLPNNNASIRAIKLNSGRIAVIFNHFSANDDPDKTVWPYERYPVTIALSEDEGKTWPYMRHIELGEQFCGERNKGQNSRYEYPYILQTKDGLIHVAYSYKNRECIKYVCVSEEWVMGPAGNNWPWSRFPLA